jgi:acetyltransferase-like isoleucine patch superfamily enzyme
MSKTIITRLFATSVLLALIRAFAMMRSAVEGVANRAYASYLWRDAWKKDAYIFWNCRVKYPERIVLGRSVRIGPNCILGGMGGINMGDHVRLSEGACVETGGLDISGPPPYAHVTKPIVLGKGVWLGCRSIVLAGVTIGEGSVVGAGAIVTRDIPPDSVAVGCPAKAFPKSKR